MALRRVIWPRPSSVVVTKHFTGRVGFSYVPRPALRFFGRFSPLVLFPSKAFPSASELESLSVDSYLGSMNVEASASPLVEANGGSMDASMDAPSLIVNGN